jgi:hypothetical protein
MAAFVTIGVVFEIALPYKTIALFVLGSVFVIIMAATVKQTIDKLSVNTHGASGGSIS